MGLGQIGILLHVKIAPETSSLVLQLAETGGSCPGCNFYRNEAPPKVGINPLCMRKGQVIVKSGVVSLYEARLKVGIAPFCMRKGRVMWENVELSFCNTSPKVGMAPNIQSELVGELGKVWHCFNMKHLQRWAWPRYG